MHARLGRALGVFAVENVGRSDVNGIDLLLFKRGFQIIVRISLYAVALAQFAVLFTTSSDDCCQLGVFSMKILAGLIRRELQLQANEYGHCAVYEDELQRVWPLDEENRKAKIEQFANENGFRLIYYKPGLCAIFEEERVNKKPTINGKICAD